MSTLIERAREIAADAYIRDELKNPTPFRLATEWAAHIETYVTFLHDGSYDRTREVQTALLALRGAA